MAKPPSRKTGRSGGSSIFTGLLIGLIVGAMLAVGVAMWVTGFKPFAFKSPAVATSRPAAAAKASPPATPAATPEPAPSFDFYKVLPGDTSSELPPPPTPAAHAPLLYLQAGAFQNPAEADNLKAQLALLGVEAAIQTSNQGSKGVYHRVRIGPFRTMDEVNRTRALLAQNKIAVTLVKETPTTEETH